MALSRPGRKDRATDGQGALMRDSDHIDPDHLSQGVKIRAAADGEIPAHQAGPDPQGAIAFERMLCASVGRAMGEADELRTPEGLRERVQAAIAADAAGERPDSQLAERLVARAEQTRSQSFWSGQMIVSVSTLAAAILMMAAVLNFSSPASVPASNLSYSQTLAQFVSGEHARIAENASAAASKLVVTSHDDAIDRLASRLGAPPVAPPVGSGVGIGENAVTFRGFGDCAVPGEGASGHSQYFINNGDAPEACVSLFVKLNDKHLEIEPGITYELKTGVAIDGPRVIIWTDGKLTYLLVADDPQGQICERILDQMGQSAPTGTL